MLYMYRAHIDPSQRISSNKQMLIPGVLANPALAKQRCIDVLTNLFSQSSCDNSCKQPKDMTGVMKDAVLC